MHCITMAPYLKTLSGNAVLVAGDRAAVDNRPVISVIHGIVSRCSVQGELDETDG